MPYLNDVFISYKRGIINEQWLNEVFLPFFRNYLDNELDHTPKIFVDTNDLTPGVDFENELFKNLIYSKCLVSIWSPPYFRRSEWCIKEFLSMRYKQEYFEIDADKIPYTLLWPVMFRKVDPLPPAVGALTYLDYSDYNVVGEAFTKDVKYLNFQKKLEKDIKSLGYIINNVPEYDAYWDTDEGRTIIINELNTYFDVNNDFDKIPIQKAIKWSSRTAG